jgi:ATP-binding cassette subfamily B protein/subfamily B ATP-binding cassette protein MsbA
MATATLPARLPAYRTLLAYLARDRAAWTRIVLFTIASTVVAILGPFPLRVLVDQGLGGQRPADVVGQLISALPGADRAPGIVAWASIAGLLLFAASAALDVLLTLSWVRAGQGIVYRLAQDLYRALLGRSLLFHARHPTGDSLERVTGDAWAVHTLVDTLVFAPAHAALMAVAMVGVMMTMDPFLAGASLVLAPLMVIPGYILGGSTRAISRSQREIDSGITSHVQQVLAGIPVVQSFSQEEREHARLRKSFGAAIRSRRRAAVLASLSDLGSGTLTTLGRAAVLLLGSEAVLAGRMTVGTLLVFLAYLGPLQTQLRTLADVYGALQRVGGNVDRVMEVLDARREVEDRPDARPLRDVRGELRFDDVTFGYEQDHAVLRGISLAVAAGETLAIVGPTGAGKSTLVSLVPRFFDPWVGRILIDGIDAREVRLRDLREQVALVLQEPFLFPLTIADNIAYGRPDATRAEIEAAAHAANAHAFITRLPEGYGTVIGERGGTLSGGERQRLSIARALLKNAPILILDEPTSALDAETEELLLQALDRLMAGRTTLIIAHRLSTIRRADRIAVLRDGAIVELGPHADLIAADGFYAHLHRIQFGGQVTFDAARPMRVPA